jgi:hypothetical protein
VSLILTKTDERCDECYGAENVLLLTVAELEQAGIQAGLALCLQCRIRAEAMLRGARKNGPPAGQWQREVAT